MLVPVAVMSGMAVAVVQVVDVIVVSDRLMPAIRPVHVVGVVVVADVTVRRAFIPVTVVQPVRVAVMEVIDMVTVGDGNVAAAVPMLVSVVLGVGLVGSGHRRCAPRLSGMGQRVGHDVSDVVVGEGVRHLPPPALGAHHMRPSQDTKVLGYERL